MDKGLHVQAIHTQYMQQEMPENSTRRTGVHHVDGITKPRRDQPNSTARQGMLHGHVAGGQRAGVLPGSIRLND